MTSQEQISKEQSRIGQFLLESLKTKWDRQQDLPSLKKAFSVMQNIRTHQLKAQLIERDVLRSCQLPVDLEREWLRVKEKMALAAVDMKTTTGKEYIDMMHQIKNLCPAFDAIHRFPIADVNEIQSKLADDETLLSFVRVLDSYHVFHLIPREMGWKEIKKAGEIDSMVQKLMRIAGSKNAGGKEEETFLHLSHDLYKHLIAPHISSLEIDDPQTIYIAASGVLEKLPFEILMKQRATSWLDIKQYLISSATLVNLSYVHEFVEKLEGEEEKKKNESIAAFGMMYSPQYQRAQKEWNCSHGAPLDIDHLSNSILEVKNICKKANARCFIESEATISAFSNAMDQFAIVHFAGHSTLDSVRPENSGLMLFPDSTQHDRFTFLDAVSKQRNNDLLVLSSCNSSDGKLFEGEGVLGMSRAFIQSGVNEVIGSMWNASDASASFIMSTLYDQLDKGQNAVSALRHAKLDYFYHKTISDPIHAKPYFWAGWKSFGYSAQQERYSPWPMILIFAVVASLVGIWMLITQRF